MNFKEGYSKTKETITQGLEILKNKPAYLLCATLALISSGTLPRGDGFLVHPGEIVNVKAGSIVTGDVEVILGKPNENPTVLPLYRHEVEKGVLVIMYDNGVIKAPFGAYVEKDKEGKITPEFVNGKLSAMAQVPNCTIGCEAVRPYSLSLDNSKQPVVQPLPIYSFNKS